MRKKIPERAYVRGINIFTVAWIYCTLSLGKTIYPSAAVRPAWKVFLGRGVLQHFGHTIWRSWLPSFDDANLKIKFDLQPFGLFVVVSRGGVSASINKCVWLS